jgi:uncharacterized delta-60 repeat protein
VEKNGSVVYESTNLEAHASVIYSINSLKVTDSGTYDLVVSNSFGVDYSVLASLAVNDINDEDVYSKGANGRIDAIVVQPDGKIILGGDFSKLASQSRKYIGRVNSDGILDETFNLYADGAVYTIAVQPDKCILLGGMFTNICGNNSSYIGRINNDGSMDTSFRAVPNDVVYNIAIQTDGKILIGGIFTKLGEQSSIGFGRLNNDGSVDSKFKPVVRNVNSIALQPDGKMVVAGDIESGISENCSRIWRLNEDGSLDTGFNTANPVLNCQNYQFAITISLQADGKIIVGGYCGTNGLAKTMSLIRLTCDGNLDTTFNTELNGEVNTIATQCDGKIVIGGAFTVPTDSFYANIARLNPDGSLDNSFKYCANSYVEAIALKSDGTIMAGGAFNYLNVMPQNNFAVLENTQTSLDLVYYDGYSITWTRGATSPEVWCAKFEACTNGTDWFILKNAVRATSFLGWQVTGLSLPATARIRIRGFVAEGRCNSCSWFIETQSALTASPLVILLNDEFFGLHTNAFEFTVDGLAKREIVIEASTNLLDYVPILTNEVGNSEYKLIDTNSQNYPKRFYRAKVIQN